MNILNVLRKEVEKGNDYVNEMGDFISLEKVKKSAEKVYLKEAKEGKLDIAETSFKDYLDTYLNRMTEVEMLEYVIMQEIVADTNADYTRQPEISVTDESADEVEESDVYEVEETDEEPKKKGLFGL